MQSKREVVCVNAVINGVGRAAAGAALGVLAAAALMAAPASARPVDAPAASAAKASCGDMPFRDRTRVATDKNPNVAGVVFRPKGDRFHIWDNVRDDEEVLVYYNYAGIDDDWKPVPGTPFDGGQDEFRHNLREGRQICFQIQVVGYPDSPIVRYST
jgi:hypothetical protein